MAEPSFPPPAAQEAKDRWTLPVGAVLTGLALWAGYGGTRGTTVDSSYALFVPLLWMAVRSGFEALDRWVLRAACSEVARWAGSVQLSVNVSGAQLQNLDLPGEVRAALAASALAASRLTLELTERMLMQEQTLSPLQQLRDLGVGLAMDDFGAGYSSLSSLRRFPFTQLKVDRLFVAALGDDPQGLPLLAMLGKLGRVLQLTTVAEGIETPEQYRQVRALGFTLAQGYLLSRPLPANEARALVERRASLAPVGKDEEPTNTVS